MYSKRALSLAFILFIVGCGATRFDTKLPDSFSLKEGQTIEFLPIENVTGKTLDPPADRIFDEYMGNLLKERKLLNLSSQPALVVLKSKLTEYEAGNAFGRWLLPGLGTTVCTVDAELLDKTTGALIGRMQSRQTVSFGGAYSIGADNYICKRVADDLIREIDKKINK
ncbi:MAG TPA: DUF4410 domain-containing protein [Candidatus Binatia bacterium]|nr:DUF4410 domain-containing protein [Candidatus Binatia bacterium]